MRVDRRSHRARSHRSRTLPFCLPNMRSGHSFLEERSPEAKQPSDSPEAFHSIASSGPSHPCYHIGSSSTPSHDHASHLVCGRPILSVVICFVVGHGVLWRRRQRRPILLGCLPTPFDSVLVIISVELWTAERVGNCAVGWVALSVVEDRSSADGTARLTCGQVEPGYGRSAAEREARNSNSGQYPIANMQAHALCRASLGVGCLCERLR